jgi:hypothetical protein
MHLGVSIAFVSAELAGKHTRAQDRLGYVPFVCGLPREHTRRRLADVGTVEIEPNTPRQICNHRFGEVGVSARGA